MTEPSEPTTDTVASPIGPTPGVDILGDPATGFHDLLIAATDDDLERALDRFVTVARTYLGVAIAVALHPSLGASTWLSDDAPDDLVDRARVRGQQEATVLPIEGAGARLHGWLVVDAADLDGDRRVLADRLVRLFAQALGRLAASGNVGGADRRDLLTGLGNRRALEVALWSAASERSSPWSLVLSKVTGLDHVHAVHGPDTVDDVIKAVGDRLHGEVRDMDLAVRLDDSTFAVLVNADRAEVEALAGRIRDKATGRVATNAGTVDIGLEQRIGSATSADSVTRLLDSTQRAHPL